jgi:hypothetical protein
VAVLEKHLLGIACQDGITLSAGTHTITVSVDVKGVQFYGFRVCSAFSEARRRKRVIYAVSTALYRCGRQRMSAGQGLQAHLRCSEGNRTPRSSGMRISRTTACSTPLLERRFPAHGRSGGRMNIPRAAFIPSLTAADSLRGTMTDLRISTCGRGWRSRQEALARPDLLRQSFLLPELQQSGRGAVERQHQARQLQQTISRTPSSDLRTDPTMYTIEMRIRGSTVRVYSGASNTLRFTATVSGFSGGTAGYQSDQRTVCELLRMGDSWTYEPYERSTSPSRTARSRSTAGSAGATAPGTRSFRYSR